ncbi:hypothetical protein [Nibricoccus sp. IMCC34717]|uniref:hypothetical protein n=1 Tax=Nibricoccus sp. IMCC34717 TaxID=3034021 RepID=UPI00384B0EB3
MNYSSHLSSEAVAVFSTLTKREQRKVLDYAERLARHPFGVSDYQSTDSQGRALDNLLIDRYVFVYWLDHASREVRIIEIVLV